MDNINTSIDLSDTSSTVSYESETYAEDILDQQYPLGAQNIFKEFPNNNFVTENGKELY